MQFDINVNDETIINDDYWRLCVGSCHAATALREDYRNMLKTCKSEIGFKYIRFHGLFHDDMCVIRKSLSGEFVYSFVNIDNIFDFFLSIGIRPFVELGFTPDCLKSGEEKIFHYKANVTPPKEDKWCELIREFLNHMIARYGLNEVRKWYFEVWNEPNLGKESGIVGGRFWSGSMEDYYNLYKITSDTVKEVDSHLRVGGPATSNNALIPEMLEFCRSTNTAIDFVTTHHYPTDIVLGYGVEDSQNFANAFNALDWTNKDELHKLISDYVTFQSDIWAKVDRGVLTDMTKRAKEESNGLPLIYTEWSSLAGLESDGAFGASFIAKTVMDNAGLVEGYSYWTFCDIVEEKGMPNCEFHGGFGLMTLSGIKKAPFNAFALLAMIGDKRYVKQYSKGTLDVYAFKDTASSCIQFLAVNHQSLMHDIDDENITISVAGGELKRTADIYRVDENHSNALKLWKDKGSNPYPDKAEILALKSAAELQRESIEIEGNTLKLCVPAQGIALVNTYLI